MLSFAAQKGGFLLGGVPKSQRYQLKKGWDNNANQRSAQRWNLKSVLLALGLALNPQPFQLLEEGPGAPPIAPLFTLRIKGSAKQELSAHVKDQVGITWKTLFPDYAAFKESLDKPAP